MNIYKKTAKITAIGLFVGCISACSTTGYKTVEPWQGKVWRGVIAKTLVDTTSYRPSKDVAESSHYDLTRDIGIRATQVHFSSGWNSVLVTAGVPDSIDFEELPKGTLVDVVTVRGPDTDYSTGQVTRVIRIVCKNSDAACLGREKDAKRYGAVIEENPAHQSYSLTFNKRESKEDVQKYD